MNRALVMMLLGTFSTTADAGGLLQNRSTVLLCQESVDGTSAAVCTLDATLLDWLRQEGARTMDATQTERIRRQMAPEQWQNPANLKGVDLLDADYAVVVTTRGSLQMNVGKMKSYLVQVAFRVVDVSRGNVVHAADLSANGLGLNGNAAMLQGCTALWAQKREQIRSGLEEALAAPVVQDVWVYDVPDLGTVNTVEEKLRSTPGVAEAHSTAFTKGVARWRLQLKPGTDPSAVAKAVDGGDSPLVTQGLVGGVLQLSWRPLARVKLPVRLSTKSEAKVPPWFARAAAELSMQQVRAAGWMRVLDASSVEKAVEFRVDVGVGAKGYVIKTSARGAKGVMLGAALETGQEAALPEMLQRALDRMLADVRKGLERNPGEYADLRRALTAPAGLTATLTLDDGAGVLRVGEGTQWATQGLGSVKLSSAVDEISTRVRLGGGEWKSLASVQHADQVRLLLAVDAVSLGALPRPTSLTLEAEVNARAGERLHRFVLSHAVMVLPVRAMVWSHPDTYAAFIAPSAPWARALAVAHANSRSSLPTPNTARLAETWDALQSKGLRYVPDPVTPFGVADLDLVQLPTETLSTGGGDCDDLVAVVATAFEAAGASTLVLKTPRHVMLAVDTGLPMGAWPLFLSSERNAFNHQGRLYLPVETTAVGVSFWEAVERGGARLALDRAVITVLDPRTGWKQSPPLEQPGTVEFAGAKQRSRVRVMVMNFAAPAALESAARVATRAAAAELSADPLLEVVTEEQVQDLAALSRVQMLSGCEGAECVSDLGRAMAVRAILTGRVELLGAKAQLHINMQDVASMTSEAAAAIRAPSAEDLSEALVLPVRGVARTYLERRVPSAVPASPAEGPSTLLEAHLGKEPAVRARFYALHGRLGEARAAAALIKEPARRALVEGNIALLEGRVPDARALLVPLGSDSARLNLAFATCAGSSAADCSTAAQGLSVLKVAEVAGLPKEAVTTVEGTGEGPEGATRDLARNVMDAAQGRAPRPLPTTSDAPSTFRWLLQW